MGLIGHTFKCVGTYLFIISEALIQNFSLIFLNIAFVLFRFLSLQSTLL